jgi:predicted permease
MSSFTKWLIVWGLGAEEARIYFFELDELFQKKLASTGPQEADRWRRKEIRRAWLQIIQDRLRNGSPVQGGPRKIGTGSGGNHLLSGFKRDFTFGMRALRRRPTFAALSIGLLGLGIGAFSVTVSLVEGVLLRELPYPGTGELVKVWQTLPEWQGLEGRDEFWDKIGFSWEEFLTLREETEALRAVAAFRTRTMILTGNGFPERLDVGEATSGLFPLLGVRPHLGRLFLPGEEGPGSERLAVISNDLWASRFGSDPEVVGKTIQLDSEPFEVVGVLPPGFRLRSTFYDLLNQSMDAGDRAIWVPIHFEGVGLGAHELEGIGRLAEGSSIARLRSELETVLGKGRSPGQWGFRITHPRAEITDPYRSSLFLLMATSGALLLIACGSIAVLYLSEASARGQEIATRMALGAKRGTLLGQFLTESLLVGLLGALLGLAVAWGGLCLLGSLAPPVPRMEEVGLNLPVLLAAIVAGIGTSVLFGIAPVSLLGERSLRIGQGLRGRGISKGGGKIHKWVIGTELAFSVIVLVNGGLLTRSLIKLTQVDPGFDARGVATVQVPLPTSGDLDSERVLALYREILEEVSQLSGVEMAGAADGLPYPGLPTGDQFEIGEREGYITPRDHIVLPGYVETMGIPLLAGRSLVEADYGPFGLGVALVNETMAHLYWPDQSPIGEVIRQGPLVFEIVGIVGDVLESRLSAAPLPTVFRNGPRIPQAGMCVVARTRGDPTGLVQEMRRAVWRVAPHLPLDQETTLAALVNNSTISERYRSALVMIVASLAGLIASIGVFGVTAHTVSRRSREMGIRKALGGTDAKLIWEIVRSTSIPIGLGLGAGAVGALGASRMVEGLIFGIGAWDAPTFLAVTVLLSTLAWCAAAIPAARVSRVQPIEVIRE